MAEGSMKVMKNKWCWIGLVLCTSSLAWAAKGKKVEQSASDSKKVEKSDSDTKASAAADSASSDEGGKDDTADEEEAPKAAPKKATKAEVQAELKPSESKVIEIAALGSLGGSTFTRFGAGLRLGLDWGEKEGLYVGLIGTYFAGTSVTDQRINGNGEKTRRATLIAAEVGYNVELSTDFLVRPYLAPGVALVTDRTCATGKCWKEPNNGAKLTMSPGLQAAYLVAPFFYIGGDLRYQIIMNTSDATAAVISLTVGLRI